MRGPRCAVLAHGARAVTSDDELRARRAQHADAIRKQRSEFVRAGIIRAIPEEVKLTSLDRFGLATKVRWRIDWYGPAWCGLKKVPYVETVSDVLRDLQSQQLATAPDFAHQPLKAERFNHLMNHSRALSST